MYPLHCCLQGVEDQSMRLPGLNQRSFACTVAGDSQCGVVANHLT